MLGSAQSLIIHIAIAVENADCVVHLLHALGCDAQRSSVRAVASYDVQLIYLPKTEEEKNSTHHTQTPPIQERRRIENTERGKEKAVRG